TRFSRDWSSDVCSSDLHEGDTGEAMYVILDGELDVSVKSGNVQELVARRAQGEVVGELALLGRTRRAASVRAATPARLLEVDRRAEERRVGREGGARAC